MKITVTDSNKPPEEKKAIEAAPAEPVNKNIEDQWFERDKVVSALQALIDPAQEFIERSKISAAIRSGMMVDEDEMELPAKPVILEDTQAMKELDKILAEYNAANPKPADPAPLA